jgi:hypothetical protein
MRQTAKRKGRIVQCSCCARGISQGTSQVYRKILFHFCAACWTLKRAACNRFMANC